MPVLRSRTAVHHARLRASLALFSLAALLTAVFLVAATLSWWLGF